MKSQKGEKEVWECRVYRDRGRAACSAPQLRTDELDQVMAEIFSELTGDRTAIINAVMTVLQAIPQEQDHQKDVRRLEEELTALQAKKDRLLEMSIDGVITIEEFKHRNDGFNAQIQRCEASLEEMRQEEEKRRTARQQTERIRTALAAALSFENGIDTALVTSILKRIIVKKGSTKDRIHLVIHLKFGEPYDRVIDRSKVSDCSNRSRTVEANGKRAGKACTDAALRELIRDKAKGKTFWHSSGQAVFCDYNRDVTICWEVVL